MNVRAHTYTQTQTPHTPPRGLWLVMMMPFNCSYVSNPFIIIYYNIHSRLGVDGKRPRLGMPVPAGHSTPQCVLSAAIEEHNSNDTSRKDC